MWRLEIAHLSGVLTPSFLCHAVPVVLYVNNVCFLQTRTSHSQDDSTRLPISHPDHSLGAGLGPQSDTEPLEKDSDEDTTIVSGADVEGELPWAPKPKQVL